MNNTELVHRDCNGCFGASFGDCVSCVIYKNDGKKDAPLIKLKPTCPERYAQWNVRK